MIFFLCVGCVFCTQKTYVCFFFFFCKLSLKHNTHINITQVLNETGDICNETLALRFGNEKDSMDFRRFIRVTNTMVGSYLYTPFCFVLTPVFCQKKIVFSFCFSFLSFVFFLTFLIQINCNCIDLNRLV